MKCLDELSLPEAASFIENMKTLIDWAEIRGLDSEETSFLAAKGRKEVLKKAKECLHGDLIALCRRYNQLEEW